ncbi:hypothetical protein B0H14DRAFT_2497685 [Mycena olivaceomarginata]|nr:hypothetical protein B0H14DRAFT_2497685 [Mycena olivaceomarginata]
MQAEAAATKGLKVLLACNRLTRPAFGLPHKYHNLMHTWRLDPADFETIRPFPVPPTWIPPFTHVIAPNKEDALEQALTRSRDHDLCLYSDGSGIDGHIGAACITDQRDDTFSRRLHLGSSHDHTVFESEVVGATLALSSIPSLPHLKRIFLGIDNQRAIHALRRPRQQPGQYLLLEFHAELDRLKARAQSHSPRSTPKARSTAPSAPSTRMRGVHRKRASDASLYRRDPPPRFLFSEPGRKRCSRTSHRCWRRHPSLLPEPRQQHPASRH